MTKSNNKESEDNVEDDPDVMQEFEDLLNYTGEDESDMQNQQEDQVHHTNHNPTSERNDNEDTKTNPINEKKKKDKKKKRKLMSDEDEIQMNQILENVEQVAYEARLAQLVLLKSNSTKKNQHHDHRNGNADTEKLNDVLSNDKKMIQPVDFVPTLAFNDTLQNDNNDNDNNNNNNKISNAPLSIKDILKQKKKKLKQNSTRGPKKNGNAGDDLDDSYWK